MKIMNRGRPILLVTATIIACFFAVQIATLLNPKFNQAELENSLFSLTLDNKASEENTVDCYQKSSSSNDASEEITTATAATPPTTTSITATDTTTDNEAINKPKTDGFFNGHPVHYEPYQEGWHSSVHCIGENFGPESWKHRSCHFQNLCFDMKNQSFVLFTSPEQIQLEEAVRHANLTEFTTAFSMNTTVSIGGINSKWGRDAARLEWFPKLIPIDELKNAGGQYMFSNDAALIPFHSFAGFNPGHLVWDDFLPIYTLLSMFQLLEKDLVLMRYKHEFWQWASCDRRWNTGRDPHCKVMLKKFLPLMGQQLETMTTQENFNMTWSNDNNNVNKNITKYVCATNGAAGLGMLTDHGQKLHGWKKSDYEFSHNIGRGGLLLDFRNYMLKNTNIKPDKSISKPPYKIVFSVASSSTSARSATFEEHKKLLKERLGEKYPMEIISVKLSSMSLPEQNELVSGASIMITMCGGGAVTGMFLPKGASLLTFFNEEERGGDTSPRLDWDLLNNLGYIRVHWLPKPQKNLYDRTGPSEADYEAFIRLMDHELDIISHRHESSHKRKV